MVDRYIDIAKEMDNLLGELSGTVDNLDFVLCSMSEVSEPTAKGLLMYNNALWSAVRHIERLNSSLQEVSDKLWHTASEKAQSKNN